MRRWRQWKAESTVSDKFDEMAAIAGQAGGLDRSQWPGLAIILRSLARDTIKACENAVIEAPLDDRSRRIARKAISLLLTRSNGDRSDVAERPADSLNQTTFSNREK